MAGNVVYHKPGLESVLHLFAIDFPAMIVLIVVAASTRINQIIKYSVISRILARPFWD